MPSLRFETAAIVLPPYWDVFPAPCAWERFVFVARVLEFQLWLWTRVLCHSFEVDHTNSTPRTHLAPYNLLHPNSHPLIECQHTLNLPNQPMLASCPLFERLPCVIICLHLDSICQSLFLPWRSPLIAGPGLQTEGQKAPRKTTKCW